MTGWAAPTYWPPTGPSQPDAHPALPPSVAVYRSVRAHGDTKTMRSRRHLALPKRGVDALLRHRSRQPAHRATPDALVFGTSHGTELDAHNVRRSFRRVLDAAGLDSTAFTRASCGTAPSPCSPHRGLVGHSGTAVTEKVYRHELHAVLDDGAIVMDDLFPTPPAS